MRDGMAFEHPRRLQRDRLGAQVVELHPLRLQFRKPRFLGLRFR